MTNTAPTPIKVFIAYSQKDTSYLEDFKRHIAILSKGTNPSFTSWSDQDLKPGEEWDSVIKDRLDSAEFILLLVSSHALASDYFRERELESAITRHKAGTAVVVPIILSPCIWDVTSLKDIQALPPKGIPITKSDPDTAWDEIVRELKIKAEIFNVRKKYINYLESGERAYIKGDWTEARESFQKASDAYQVGFPKSDAYIAERISDCDTQIVKMGKIKAQYALTDEAENLFKKRRWRDAFNKFSEAQEAASAAGADPKEQEHLKVRLVACREEEQREMHTQSIQQFNNLLQEAERCYIREEWERAIQFYKQALAIYPESFHQAKREYEEKILLCEVQNTFKRAGESAQEHFKGKQYKAALVSARKALVIKPEDEEMKKIEREARQKVGSGAISLNRQNAFWAACVFLLLIIAFFIGSWNGSRKDQISKGVKNDDELQAFDFARRIGTIEAYNIYLEKFISGQNRQAAITAIDSIRKAIDSNLKNAKNFKQGVLLKEMRESNLDALLLNPTSDSLKMNLINQ